MADLQLDLNQSHQFDIAEFKRDPEKMRQVNDFLNELFETAQVQVEIKTNAAPKPKTKLQEALGIQNGTRRIGQWSNRARSQARTFATRIFTTICNCTNSVKSVVVNRNQ